MTTPDERSRALLQTRQFLVKLCKSGCAPGAPDIVRREARRLLRHYPDAGDVDLVAMAFPQWWSPASEPSTQAVSYIEILMLVRELTGAEDIASVLAQRRMG